MKIHYKLFFCLTLLLLALSACRTNTDTDPTYTAAANGEGRYIETDITPPMDAAMFMSFVNDNHIIAVKQDLSEKFASADNGVTWTALPWDVTLPNENVLYASSATLLSDGRLLAFVQDMGLFLFSEDGNAEEFVIQEIAEALANEDMVLVSYMDALRDDRLLISYTIVDNSMGLYGMRSVGAPRTSGTEAEETDENQGENGENQENSENQAQGQAQQNSENQARGQAQGETQQNSGNQAQGQAQQNGENQTQGQPRTRIQGEEAPQENGEAQPRTRIQSEQSPEENNETQPRTRIQGEQAPQQNNEAQGETQENGESEESQQNGEAQYQNQPQGQTRTQTNGQTQPRPQSPPQGGQPQRREQRVQGGGAAASAMGFRQKTALIELPTGTPLAELDIQGTVTGSAISGDTFYLLKLETSGNTSEVKQFSLADGTEIADPITLGSPLSGMGFTGFGMSANANLLAVNANGEIFAVHADNLMRVADGAVSTFLEGTAYAFGSPNSHMSSVNTLSDGSIVIGVMGEGSRLYKLYWDENARINPEQTIRIWSLENNNLVRAAIAEIRTAYPNSYITYEVALSQDGGMSASDAINTLNVELLANKGPDILILDGTPAENYINRRMLLDLSEIDTSAMYENLLAPYVAQNGEIYVLPMQLLMPLLASPSDLVAQAQTFEALVNQVVTGNGRAAINQRSGRAFQNVTAEERSALHFDTLQELAYIMWCANLPAIVSNNQLNSDALREHLTAIKAISDKYELVAPVDENAPRMSMMVSTSRRGRGAVMSGSIMQYMMRTTNYAVFPLENLMTVLMLTGSMGRMAFVDEAVEPTQLVPFPGLTAGVWQPSTMTAVSAGTNVPDFAKEIVGALLSQEVQQSNQGEGLPVTRAGMAQQVIDINDSITQLNESRMLDEEQPLLEIDFDALIEQLTTPALVERALYEMVYATKERLCSGALDLDGAVREIEQNTRNYLAERG